jgi:hypothetical protein
MIAVRSDCGIIVDLPAKNVEKEKIMLFRKRLTVGCVIGLVTLCLVASARTQAQSNKPAESVQGDRDQILKQLLAEVRALRLALQRATVSSIRVQMLIERVRVEQGQVDSLSGQLVSVRSQLTKLKAEKVDASRMKDLEDRLGQSSGDEHATIERTLKEGKSWLESKVAEEQQQIEAQADLSMRLQVEQSKLNELNTQLDSLMSEMKAP